MGPTPRLIIDLQEIPLPFNQAVGNNSCNELWVVHVLFHTLLTKLVSGAVTSADLLVSLFSLHKPKNWLVFCKMHGLYKSHPS